MGDSISFDHPFQLLNDVDLSGLTATVNYSDTTADGSNYQNTLLDNRTFPVTFFIEKVINDPVWYEEQRSFSFRVLNPHFNPMRVDFETAGGKSYFINANLDSLPNYPKGFENDNRLWAKGIIFMTANDPYIYQTATARFEMGTWVGDLEFPLEITEGGIEIGHYEDALITDIKTTGHLTTGMNIQLLARDHVTNPSFTNAVTYEVFRLEIAMVRGDVIEISTYRGNKSIYLIRDNIKTDIFSSLSLASTFLQLQPGSNLIKYDADSGLDNLEAIITFNNSFLGV